MNLREWTMISILALLFGSSFFFTEIAAPEVGPTTIAASRLAIGGMVLCAVLFGRARPVRVPTLRQMAILGLFNSLVPITFIAWAQHELASGVAAMLAATSPVFGAIFAHFYSANERLTWARALGTASAFVGVALILDPEALIRLEVGIAPLAVLVAAASGAAAGVFGRRVLSGDVSPAAAAAGQVVAAASMATLLSLIVEQPWERPYPGVSSVASIVAMGLLSTALAYGLYFYLLEKVGAANTLLVGFLVPVWATLLGVVLLQERLSMREIMGLALVLLSLLIINGKGSSRGDTEAPTRR